MNKSRGWYYYNRAYLSDTQPHQIVDASQVLSGEIWKKGHSKAILARWTSDFDSNSECNWWYIIKDTPFDISSIKAKRRYEINKGKKFFNVRRIDPCKYLDELFAVQVAAYSVYPKKYRPMVKKNTWSKMVLETWAQENIYVFGAFDVENSNLCGYAKLIKQGSCVNFSVLKTNPECEKQSINAAIVAYIVDFFQEGLRSGVYICDGSRNIQHETAFQDYLEKYFEFRKAYCKLHVEYNPKYKWIIKILYVFRKILRKFDNIRIVHKINGVLKMEEIVRQQEKDKNG